MSVTRSLGPKFGSKDRVRELWTRRVRRGRPGPGDSFHQNSLELLPFRSWVGFGRRGHLSRDHPDCHGDRSTNRSSTGSFTSLRRGGRRPHRAPPTPIVWSNSGEDHGALGHEVDGRSLTTCKEGLQGLGVGTRDLSPLVGPGTLESDRDGVRPGIRGVIGSTRTLPETPR